MALDITDYLLDIFEYLCETACLHLIYCIPRLMSSKPTPKAHALWTDTGITWLITFFYEHQAEGTDRGFEKLIYIAAAEDLPPPSQRRREKLGNLQMAMDKGKNYLLTLLSVAQKLAQTGLCISGLIWICLESKSQWGSVLTTC
jgi:hypothetical protein